MESDKQVHSAERVCARCAVITLSDSRSPAEDLSGDRICALLSEASHEVTERTLLPDEPRELAAVLDRWLYRDDIDCAITTGGTGISSRDRTVGVVRERLSMELPGFGELFRQVSFEEIGPAALLSRALGGISGPPNPSAVFVLPGSVNAVETGVSRLIVPVLGHLLSQLRR